MQPLTGTTLTVKAFHFSGNTLLSAEQLTPVVAGFLGRVLDFTELQQAAVAVAEAYRTAGWIVRVYLPQQEIRDGIVTLQIVEAVFGGARFEGAAPGRIAPSRLIAGIEAGQAKGALLNVEAIDRALLLAGDLPGVAVSGSLAEGRNDKETDLVLKVPAVLLAAAVVFAALSVIFRAPLLEVMLALTLIFRAACNSRVTAWTLPPHKPS